MGAAARGGHGISAGPAATLAASPICAGATNWPAHVERPNCGTAVDDGRGCEKSRASFRFCGISGSVSSWLQPNTVQVLRDLGIDVELAPAEHLDRGLSAERLVDWLRPHFGGRVRIVDGAEVELERPDAGGAGEQPRSRAPPTKSVRAHFCLPEALHLG
jgi:hypothetical protein